MPTTTADLTPQQLADLVAFLIAGPLSLLPPDFPRDVEVVATDLDHTLIWTDDVLRPRTLAALARARRRRAARDRRHRPDGAVAPPRARARPARTSRVVCYQGAAVVAADGDVAPARADRAASSRARRSRRSRRRATSPNVYVDDELYVSRITPEAERYANFQQIPTPRGRRRHGVARPAADEARLRRRPRRARRARRADAGSGSTTGSG